MLPGGWVDPKGLALRHFKSERSQLRWEGVKFWAVHPLDCMYIPVTIVRRVVGVNLEDFLHISEETLTTEKKFLQFFY